MGGEFLLTILGALIAMSTEKSRKKPDQWVPEFQSSLSPSGVSTMFRNASSGKVRMRVCRTCRTTVRQRYRQRPNLCTSLTLAYQCKPEFYPLNEDQQKQFSVCYNADSPRM